MTTTQTHSVLPADVAILRGLAQRVREAAESPVNQERLQRWYAHDEGEAVRPLIVTETDAGIQLVIPDYQPACQQGWAQQQEWWLRMQLCHFEQIQDDYPLEAAVNCSWHIGMSDYGVATHSTQPKTEGTRGAYHIDAPLQDLERDFPRLQPRSFTVDRDASLAAKALLDEVYDGILTVQWRGNPWWTMGLTWDAISLIGLENLMLYMYDQPEALHQLMGFLRDDRTALLDWMTREELLMLNNANDYVGSGSYGYTRRLPRADRAPGSPLETADLWTLIESQETVSVGPEQYAEFIFPYENSLAERFGGIYYGCCEPVHTRWHVLKHLANLRRVSISPWCDEAFMAEALGNRYVYSRKPNPTLVSTAQFDEDAIRADLRHTLRLTHAHGCPTEISMKDVHTLHNEPHRLARWVAIAREVVEEIYG